MSPVDRRVENERIFRAVNEQIERLNETFETFSGERPEFLCECDAADCTARLAIGLDQVRLVHEHPRRYVVAPGHEDPEVERVIASDGGHVVVAKIGEAASIARARDPRA